MIIDDYNTFTVIDLSSSINEDSPTLEWLEKSLPGARIHTIKADVLPAVWSRIVRPYFLHDVDAIRAAVVVSERYRAPTMVALGFQARYLGAFLQTGEEQRQTLSALSKAQQVINCQNSAQKSLADKRTELESARSSFTRYSASLPFIHNLLSECSNAVDAEIQAVDAMPYLVTSEINTLVRVLLELNWLLSKAWRPPSHRSTCKGSDFARLFIERNVHKSLQESVHAHLAELQVR